MCVVLSLALRENIGSYTWQWQSMIRYIHVCTCIEALNAVKPLNEGPLSIKDTWLNPILGRTQTPALCILHSAPSTELGRHGSNLNPPDNEGNHMQNIGHFLQKIPYMGDRSCSTFANAYIILGASPLLHRFQWPTTDCSSASERSWRTATACATIRGSTRS